MRGAQGTRTFRTGPSPMTSLDRSAVAVDSTLDFPKSQKARPNRVRFSFGGQTHAGKKRTNNEDHFLVARLAKSMEVCKSSLPDDGVYHFSDEEGYLMVVADGMGGGRRGRARQRPGGRQPGGVRPRHLQVVPPPGGSRADRP